MNWKEIEEAAQLAGYGTTIPARLRSIIELCIKRKSLFRPSPFTIDDFAVCSMLYDMTQKKAKE